MYPISFFVQSITNRFQFLFTKGEDNMKIQITILMCIFFISLCLISCDEATQTDTLDSISKERKEENSEMNERQSNEWERQYNIESARCDATYDECLYSCTEEEQNSYSNCYVHEARPSWRSKEQAEEECSTGARKQLRDMHKGECIGDCNREKTSCNKIADAYLK